ncbi:unnamed protein product [Adineta ricciae]|uniref:Uncharacterized protein n=1 Tax=Adineta ricciae TaxID=249248 RepID=A0A814HXV9_ADIRI|nr:unnamed protein product [Adineta ricciae]
MSNFDSVYNAPVTTIPQAPTYVPLTSFTTFSAMPARPPSPLFHRCESPPPRQPIFPPPGPKFNFDLYKIPDDSFNIPNEPVSRPYRPLSPTSFDIIHHRSIYSPSSPLSTPKTQTYAKLREANDELCHTLARTELSDSSTVTPHYHIHHYPLSQRSHPMYRSRSAYGVYEPSTELELSPNLHEAPVTYRVHFPPEHRQERYQTRKPPRHTSPPPSSSSSSSDLSSREEPIVIDLYPIEGQGFVKQKRKPSDHQSPWIVEGKSLRRGSYTDASTSRSSMTSKGLYYGDKPIKLRRRSKHDKERPPLCRSPSSRTNQRVWRPSSKSTSNKPPKYFEPTPRSNRDIPTRVRSAIDSAQSDPTSGQKGSSSQPEIRLHDPKFKRRIANAESKVKSAWEPTVIGLSSSTVKEANPPMPQSIKQTKVVTPPRSQTKPAPSEPSTPVKKFITVPPQPSIAASTAPSSVHDLPTKPIFESTPRNQSVAEKNDQSTEDLLENESHISELPKEKQPSHPPTPLPEQPRKPSTELPKSPVVEPDKEDNAGAKDNTLPNQDNRDKNESSAIGTDESANDGEQSEPPSPDVPTAEKKPASIKSTEKKDETTDKIDDTGDEDDQEVARSFDINKWLNDATTMISDGITKNGIIPHQPLPSPPRATATLKPKPKPQSPPRRKVQPVSPPRESPDHNLYKPPFGPKKPDPKPSTPPTAPSIGETDEVDDFFS